MALKKIVVFGAGYVGISNAIILSKKNSVQLIDISSNKVSIINNGRSPIADREADELLSSGKFKSSFMST